jgi:hypothetical protein
MKTSVLSLSFKVALALIVGAPGMPSAFAHDPIVDQVLEWCDSSITVLEEAQRDAQISYSRGNFSQAKSQLMQGLVNASRRGDKWGSRGSLTKLAIDRVTQIGVAVNREVAREHLGVKTTAAFLFSGYNFILEDVYDLDVNYYVQRRHGRNGGSSSCRSGCGNDASDYEIRYLRFVKAELSMVMDALSVGSSRGGSVPYGTPRAGLKALEIIAKASAADLRDSMYVNDYACTVRSLESLSRNLNAYLTQGVCTNYRNDPEAFYSAFNEGHFLASQIEYGMSCGGSNSNYGSRRGRY